jgi:hypothetical protein
MADIINLGWGAVGMIAGGFALVYYGVPKLYEVRAKTQDGNIKALTTKVGLLADALSEAQEENKKLKDEVRRLSGTVEELLKRIGDK